MPNYRRAREGSLFFFTLVTARRRPLFEQAKVRQALREAVQHVCRRYPFGIHGWVLLPDHLHCIWELPDTNYSRRWSMIKRLASQTLSSPVFMLSASQCARREAGLWQRRFWEHRIRDGSDYQRHMDYLHWNPVKHGLIGRVADWPWSSFHRLQREGIYPLEWGGSGVETGDFGE
ncbi:transposase [Pseudomonas sp. ABC1]|uniref:REP-associated tyrosine transposase n=1 Tax=Pseudomonas sp. ABC1 TaxID=2748080 RepID=UPI0015C3AF2F|nr:transposase [Pseudomonas sp. ABC1]QLF94687.1 transposase [Pseudomonas sp. ABC1]